MLAYAAAIVLMVRAGLTGDASLGLVVAAVAVSSQITGQVQSLLTMTFWTLESLRATRALLDVVEDSAAELAAAAPITPVPVPVRLNRGITLEHLGFQYWNRDQPSLHAIDLELPAGAVVALVGENGAGKSTLVKMLSGLYRPTEGRILVDGADLAQLVPEEWSARITAAFQDPEHIEMSLTDTVGLGWLEHREDPERVLQALRTAGGDAFLAALPDGPQTQLGRQSWDGKGLSGGQWQTVANARAAMRQAPLLRILDEPTSSLDARAEEWLFQQYTDLNRTEGGVTVLVTHRFTTARAADLIVVLDGGRVVEVGTHDVLSQADGPYAELFYASKPGTTSDRECRTCRTSRVGRHAHQPAGSIQRHLGATVQDRRVSYKMLRLGEAECGKRRRSSAEVCSVRGLCSLGFRNSSGCPISPAVMGCFRTFPGS